MKFRIRNFAILASSISAVSSSVSAADTWRSDLDWAGLEAKLSPTASLIDTGLADYLDECLPEFRDKQKTERSAHALIDEPSGVCVTQMFCAYERCWPRPDATTSTQAQRNADDEDTYEASYNDLSPEIQGWLNDPQNPSLNLPSKVLFPVVASDVVHAIQFARDNGLEISVKNSGHSFIGASTKKNTLHLNMNRFTEYSTTSIVDCEGVGGDQTVVAGRAASLVDQPCSLATARNKPAFIRAGGGENWDKLYRAVDAVNAAQGNKYHAVGGAAGTVSPMGWTFQGGLAGTTGGRMYGFGVDQVLQVEMVLPNGEHVKFGPAEWEDASADGFIVPKTTSVAGLCRSNPEELDENLWEWTECSEDKGINFDDLWFAVNGGGGGTWGVVTSIYLQLHEYRTPRLFGFSGGLLSLPDCNIAGKEILMDLFEYFRLTYVLNPSRLNVTQADSDGCGMADAGASALICYGDRPYETLVKEWEKFATSAAAQLAASNITLQDALSCPATLELSWSEYMKNTEGPYAGLTKDIPYPSIRSESWPGALNALWPQKYVEENFDTLMETLFYIGPGFYLAFGSGTASASDQANSLGQAHRTAGLKYIAPASDYYAGSLGEMYDTSDKSNFPSFQGSNHIGPYHMGPLKDDWTKACPDEWTMEERDEKCVSIQETIYGTKTLARLEAIKEAVDPNYMFDCFGCIGNNRKKEMTTGDDSSVIVDNSSAGRIASSIKATALTVLGVVALFVW